MLVFDEDMAIKIIFLKEILENFDLIYFMDLSASFFILQITP